MRRYACAHVSEGVRVHRKLKRARLVSIGVSRRLTSGRARSSSGGRRHFESEIRQGIGRGYARKETLTPCSRVAITSHLYILEPGAWRRSTHIWEDILPNSSHKGFVRHHGRQMYIRVAGYCHNYLDVRTVAIG